MTAPQRHLNTVVKWSGTEEESGAEKEGRQMIAAVVFVIAFSRSAGLADRKMEEIYRLSAAREAGGVDGN